MRKKYIVLIFLFSLMMAIGSGTNAYQISASTQVNSNTDAGSVHWNDSHTNDGEIMLSHDTGWVDTDSSSPNFGGSSRAVISVNLETGEVKFIGTAEGGAYTLGSGSATIQETLSFDLPLGMTSAEIGFSLDVEGTHETYPTPGGNVGGQAYAQIQLGQSTATNGGAGPTAEVVGQKFSGTVTVVENVAYPFSMSLNLSSGPGSLLNVENTARINIILPDGVSYTSESGYFLSKLPGDLNGNKSLNIVDLIAGLQVLAGQSPSGLSLNGDSNGDSKIGMDTILYILRILNR